MAQGIKALRKIQIGAEATTDQGTAVAATTIWRGMGSISNATEVNYVEEDVGILMPTNRTYISQYVAELSMEDVPATFEQFPYILEASVLACTPTTDTGSGYIRTYTLPTSDLPTVRTYTIEGGDNQAVEEMQYGFVVDWTLSGSAGEAWTMGANLQGRQVSTSAFTAPLSLPSVEEMLFGKSSLYIDESTGSFGGTLVSQTLLSGDVAYTSGLMAVFTANGELYFDFIKSTRPEGVLTVTFEHNDTAVAEKAAWLAETVRRIQLKIPGSALASGGTYTTKTALLNMIGKWESFDALGDQDGNDIVTGTFRFGYDETQATAGEFIVVNELSALP